MSQCSGHRRQQLVALVGRSLKILVVDLHVLLRQRADRYDGSRLLILLLGDSLFRLFLFR